MNQRLSSYYPPPRLHPALLRCAASPISLCPYCLLDMDERITPLILFTTSEDWENGSITCLLAACSVAYVNFMTRAAFLAPWPREINARPLFNGDMRQCYTLAGKVQIVFSVIITFVWLWSGMVLFVFAVSDTPAACMRHGQRPWARALSTTSACH